MTLIPEIDLLASRYEEGLLHRISNHIRQTLELEEIITVTTAQVRLLLGTDRVMIYKFHADGSGQVIAESISENRLPSLLGLNFPADDIPPQARELFIKSRVRSVVNVETQEIGQFPLSQLATDEIVSGDIRYRPVDSCHLEYLNAMGVKSSLVTPILYQDQLWGLLVSHHSQARVVADYELEAMQMVVDQLSVAISQSNLLTQAREKAAREAIINRITTLLHSLASIELQSALEETVTAFSGSGGRLCIRNHAFNCQSGTFWSLAECLAVGGDRIKVHTCGSQPQIPTAANYEFMEQHSIWQEYSQLDKYDIWAITDIYEHPRLRNLQVAFRSTKIRSMIMIPLQYRQQLLGYLSIFRDEIDTETLWAGQFDPDQRQLYPRLSFDVWRESKFAQSREWKSGEIDLAQELGTQFALAIQQYELYQQVNIFNANLERQVQERTLKLQQATEQQQALFGVVIKIHQTLDLDTIFKATTQEVCQALQVDRVAVYRFNSDWTGEFVGNFETTNAKNSDVSPLSNNPIWHDTYLQETQGGRYRNHEVFVVDDIYKAGLTQCHIDILEQFHIQAYATTPIFIGQKLWGLLAVYQHSNIRQWQDSEIQFLQQTSTQIGVALQQADLLRQTQQQAEQLSQALQHLKQTQTQLIQTEKMSSLGQLVAGIAHEINNPVNFIYGNINHVNEYTKDVLKMLNLYQQTFPESSPEIRQWAEEIEWEFITEDLPKTLSSMKIGVERIRQIVLGLRNFSRLDQSAMKPVDIHEGIDSTLLILQHRLKAKPENPAIQLIREYGDLPLVECYAGQLNQVFMNLLSNSIDALEHCRDKKSSSDPHQIIIRTSMGELNNHVKSVVICISDNGVGIPEDVRQQVFDPFFTTKPVGKGTGLGLSISYQIVVDKHGGILKCDSQPGLGTQFWIEIPIKQNKSMNYNG
jgi:light-regulated signal transduction histidine kinase (bacteriophytochrome)